ncbi:MAG: hypothetical protein HYY24_25230 [Verrucomicrobia bacterium]|nr:hypothetical protein [Verrucomicrobiota bacterium]
MSKRTSTRRSNQPPIPAVSLETWQALLAAAEAFGALAPWTWMHDSELLGLRDPATGDKLLCSVLGRLRTIFALLVYRRDTGRRWVLNTILNDGDPGGLEDSDSAFEQDCVKVEFTPKNELSKQDRAVLNAAGFSPTTKRGCVWPAFRSLVPGGYPWYLTQAEAEALLFALPRATAFATLLRNHPEVCDGHESGEAAFLPADFDPARRALHAEDLDWHPLIPPPEPMPPLVSLDEITLARLLKLPQAKGFHLELDVFYSPIAIGGDERPYFPKAVMAVDRASGFIGGYRLAEFSDPQAAAALAEVLTSTLQRLGGRPEAIRVQRPRVAQMVSPVAEKLGIPVRKDPELPALNFAREDMERRFRP